MLSSAEINQLIALYNAGRYTELESRARKLLDNYPDFGFAWQLLGGSLQKQGKDSLHAFQMTAKLLPDDAGAQFNLGVVQKSFGLLDAAIASYRKAVEIQPDFAEAYNNLGTALKDFGQLDGAVTSYSQALKVKPNYAEAYNNLGAALKELRQFDGAVNNYRLALKIKPDYAEAHYNLGNVLKELGQYDGAAESYRRALEFKTDFTDVYSNLGSVLKVIGQYEGALWNYRRALELEPGSAEAHNNLGTILKDTGKLVEALSSYRRAVEIKPDYAEAHYNLGNVLKELEQFDGAAKSYRQALNFKPDFADASFNLGLLLLWLGQYTEAWPLHEARYHTTNFKGNQVNLPNVTFTQWQGEHLVGKSLVIWPEQGFGDEIQFARYIPLLKNRGVSRLTLVCKPPLKDLLETLEGVDVVVPYSEAAMLPFHDYWTFPLSLPLHFSTTVENIPAKLPYLSASPERLNRWRSKLPAGCLKVGLVWKGSAIHKNDANRSLPSLSTLAKLWCTPKVTFISLQKGQGEQEAATPPNGQPILHLGSEIMDFADTAAIVAQLDLVICIDTSIAHLAGALGKPCWVLLPAVGTDWRWLRERMDSPWYPGVMRLFRQTQAGDWANTIDEVAKELAAWADEYQYAI